MTENTALVVSVPSEQLLADLQPVPEGVELLLWDLESPAPRARIDIVVPPYLRPPSILARLAEVQTRLVQSQSIGYDGAAEFLPAGRVLANAAGVHEDSTAELALALLLAAQRQIPGFVRNQTQGRWKRVFAESLADRRVLLLGYGGVGKAVAQRLAPFEVELTVVAGSARREGEVEVHGVDELSALLGTAEIVVLTLPANEQTHHIIDDAALSALPDNALVVNIGRGPLVDTEALIDHARRGRIRAALDVTDPEPLPEGHPLWELPNVLISPHVGGASTAMRPRMARLISEQIALMLRGEAPRNVVIGG